MRKPLGRIQIRLLQVTVVHEKLGDVVGCQGLVLGKHFLVDSRGSLDLPRLLLLLLSTAQLQVGPAVPLNSPPGLWVLGPLLLHVESPAASKAKSLHPWS